MTRFALEVVTDTRRHRNLALARRRRAGAQHLRANKGADKDGVADVSRAPARARQDTFVCRIHR